MYTIEANNKTYIVSEHAAQRMLQRDISNVWVITTLENGDFVRQSDGNDRYEYQIEDIDYNQIIIVQVIVNEDQLIIVTVIDETTPG